MLIPEFIEYITKCSLLNIPANVDVATRYGTRPAIVTRSCIDGILKLKTSEGADLEAQLNENPIIFVHNILATILKKHSILPVVIDAVLLPSIKSSMQSKKFYVINKGVV